MTDSIFEWVIKQYEVGWNPVPWNTRENSPVLNEYACYRTDPPAMSQIEEWIPLFEKYGVAQITGLCHRGKFRGLYLNCVDIDDPKILNKLLNMYSLEQLANAGIFVEQHHDNKDKAHLWILSNTQFPKIRPGYGVEIKTSGDLCNSFPGFNKGGYRYFPVGNSLKIFDDNTEALTNDNFVHVVDKLVVGNYLNGNGKVNGNYNPVIRNKTPIRKGERHNRIVSYTNSLIARLYKTTNRDTIYNYLVVFNNDPKEVEEPLPESELKQIFSDSWNNITRKSTVTVSNNGSQESTPDSNNNNNKDDVNKIDIPIEDTDYYEFAISTIKKTVKCEDSLIRQVVLAALSSKTDDPVNLGVMGPTSEGKTYPVTESMQYFPDKDVMNIGSMSPKVLIRQKGIIINSDTKQSIENELFELSVKIKTEKDETKKEELKQLMGQMKKNSKILIDLTGKVLIFFEPPHHELWNLLKPILSHDKLEIEFPYVDKDSFNGIETKNVVVRGFPACIFCSAKDESSWSVWPEIQSRFLITSPNMIAQKYQESNNLIAYRKGIPKFIQEKTIVSKQDVETAKNCILYIMQMMDEIKTDGTSIWIPYAPILGETLPSNKGTDVRIAKRIFSFLNLLPVVKSHLRNTLTCGEETSIVASIEDLHQVLTITQNVEGIPKYKMDFFKNIFVECFRRKEDPDTNDDGKQESIIAVTTAQLCKYYKQQTGKIIDRDNLQKTYLNELHNNGIIGEEDSNLDKRKKLYYPLVESSQYIDDKKFTKYTNLRKFVSSSQPNKILIPKNCTHIPENWLIFEILSILKYRIDLEHYNGPLGDIANEQLIFSDNKRNRQTVKEFIQEYESGNNATSLIRYFTRTKISNFHGEIFGDMKLLEAPE